MTRAVPAEERIRQFWVNVDRGDGPESCWLWKGRVNARTGYGMTPVPDRRTTSTAHRLAYVLTYGDPGTYVSPTGRVLPRCIRHRCPGGPNRVCCNPRHLFAGTDLDNAVDRAKDGNTFRGEAVPVARLTEIEVVQMRQLYEDGATVSVLARRFGVHKQTVRPALTGETWAHVPGAVTAMRHDTTKLTSDDVREIRRLRDAGWPLKTIGAEFGVSPQTVSGIATGRTWKSVA